jgi:hypothetical protein
VNSGNVTVTPREGLYLNGDDYRSDFAVVRGSMRYFCGKTVTVTVPRPLCGDTPHKCLKPVVIISPAGTRYLTKPRN